MGKLVKRLMLDDSFAIGRNESWFSDMAKEGLHLKKIGRIFIYFEKGQSKNTKYRIDILKEKPSQEQIDIYHDCGWDLITKGGDFYIFSAQELSHTPELHTDPVEQSYSLSDLNKRLRNNLILVSIAMLWFLGMIFSIYFIGRTPFLYMVQGQFVQQMLLVIVELYVFHTVIRNYIAIRNLKKSLFLGKPINHKENWRKARLINGILAGLFLPIALFAVFIPFIEIAKSENHALPETNTNLPIIRLADIEQNPNLKRKAGYSRDGIDWGNRVSFDWSLLAPIQYEITEHGIVENEMWSDNSGKYSPSIQTNFYDLTFSKIADGLVEDLIKRNIYKPDTIVKELKTTEFDRIYIAEEDIEKQIFAILADKVIYIRYFGNKDADDIIPLLYKTISQHGENYK
ncbi:MAG: DUF2812 domain-containing protein [Clostridia bacterium]